MNKRVILIVLDSLGIGEMPDAEKYGDKGSNTLGHIVKTLPDIKIPNLKALGIGNIDGIDYIEKNENATGSCGRASELSSGKDTITGHWEIAGLLTEVPFQTFPDGFPDDFMKAFEKRIGRETLGNYAASGTEIIKELGEEHIRTGKPIIYTSADSVFQIAAHEEVIPLEELYRICAVAREMLTGEMQVGRVIARPFTGENGNYARTANRKDYAVSPPQDTVLDSICNIGKNVFAVGKIEDIFNGKGITKGIHTESNMDGVDKTIELLKEDFAGLIFTNLVDFDSKYGHRRDPAGYGRAIEEFDARMPEIFEGLRQDDILILCADHGNDPVHSGWDHTREYVPVIICGKTVKCGVNLGTLSSFADIGATVAEILEAEPPRVGKSFYDKVRI